MVDRPPTGSALAAGTRAPEFTLAATPDASVSLHEHAGRPVVLVFYPADWSPVCGDQVTLYQAAMPEFKRYGAQLLGISVDQVWSHMAFAENRGLEYPLLSDFEPKGEVARTYGIYRQKEGFAERALFVIDPEGIITWSYVSPINVNPGAEGILRALDTMRSTVA
jgi:peroxiredoxin